MESPERGALLLTYFIGISLIGWTVIEITLYCLICCQNKTHIGWLPCLIRSLPLLGGVVVLIKARTIAQWVAEKLDL